MTLWPADSFMSMQTAVSIVSQHTSSGLMSTQALDCPISRPAILWREKWDNFPIGYVVSLILRALF